MGIVQRHTDAWRPSNVKNELIEANRFALLMVREMLDDRGSKSLMTVELRQAKLLSKR